MMIARMMCRGMRVEDRGRLIGRLARRLNGGGNRGMIEELLDELPAGEAAAIRETLEDAAELDARRPASRRTYYGRPRDARKR